MFLRECKILINKIHRYFYERIHGTHATPKASKAELNGKDEATEIDKFGKVMVI